MDEKTIEAAIKGKSVLITGGTGSFGSTVAKKLLNYDPARIVILSRDEKKQFDMRNAIEDKRLHLVLGDVRERVVVGRAMEDIDYVFHAAALKHVPNCELFPMEAVKTNVLGAHNVIEEAIDKGVKKVILLSTDKAVHPVNAMGMTKALMEKLMIATVNGGHQKKGTVVCATRYGNVVASRGSVVPLFIDLLKANKPLKVTNKDMTRFMMSIEESVDLVLYALTAGENGSLYVRKAPAASVINVAMALQNIFKKDTGIEEVGIRFGEKIHETLVSPEERYRANDRGNYYEVTMASSGVLEHEEFYKNGVPRNDIPEEGYTSHNTKQLSLSETEDLLRSISEIKKELA